MNWERTKRTIWWVLIIALLANAPAIAAMQGEQEQEKMGAEEQQKMQERMGEMQRKMTEHRAEVAPLHNANDMLGREVQSSDGQNVGEIADFMLDLQNDKVCAVILTMNDKLYPVPGYAFSAKAADQTCTLKLTKAKFTQAPSWDEITSENLNSADWRQRVNDYYYSQMAKEPMTKSKERMPAYGEMEYEAGEEVAAGRPERFVMLSDIIGLNIKGADKEDLADIENVLMDSKTGYLAYALVSYGGVLGIGEKMAAVPWTALSLQRGLEYATLDADRSKLEQAAVEEDDIQRLNQPAYARRIHQQFGEEPYWEVFGFVPGMEARSLAAWEPGSRYNRYFHSANVQTYQGTIRSIGSFTPQERAARGLRLKVESEDGEMMTVYAGPKHYAKMQGFRCNVSDDIKVTGAKATINGRSVIIASQITSEGKTLELRDDQGKPMWNVEALKEKMQQYKSMHEKSEESKSMY